ncbi:MAG: bifunctional transaldolase/phosoglucose isomerase [Chloroflexaceae bacterium]|nr:bifunctional transaldolase/phosoglucose isomerase [Chloroflexaceae bacterium]
MAQTKLHELAELGQAVWYDYIRRSFITSGEMQSLIDQGLRGMTSNPTIFEKAMAGSADYDDDMRRLVAEGKSIDELYAALVVDDIARAADLLRPVYDETNGLDGYISLEVSPTMAHDTEGTINEARRLHRAVNRPNLMIKVPATPEGLPAITTLIGEGISVNVTLMFSLDHYEAVAEAYISGLEKLAAAGGDLSKVASVASFFVSRVDSSVDKELDGVAGGEALKGKIAIANAAAAYDRFLKTFSGERWSALAAKGATVQRVLWASTGTKNPDYPDTMYVDNLIAPHTVNTMPPATLRATLDHATVKPTLEALIPEALQQLEQLKTLGIDLDAITQQLQVDGVASFAKSFESLMDGIEGKRQQLLAEHKMYTAHLGAYEAAGAAALEEMRQNETLKRIWEHDHTVWKDDPTEISNRLGWLHSPEVMPEHLPAINALIEAVRNEGYTHALLMGMGGSSLAPEVFRKAFGVAEGYLDLAVLDSTDPGAVLAFADALDMRRTLFVVSTKSGGTVETLSFFKYFYNKVVEAVGTDAAGQHFIAITDPGSKLETLAKTYNFRATFLNDPDIGGRYSALSFFGLVLAGLVGVDLAKLLNRTSIMAANCESSNCVVNGNNYGGQLGAAMGELAKAGRDKLTLITAHDLANFGDWVEQLVAESMGKEGKGILPVVAEPLGAPDVYGNDRVFVFMHSRDEHADTEAMEALKQAGHPVIHIHYDDVYDMGSLMFLWEVATAVAGVRLNINPFDQPNVESAKVLARQMVVAYEKEGKLPDPAPTLEAERMAVYADTSGDTPGALLRSFLDQIKAGDYVTLQAYVQPTDDTSAALDRLRLRIRDQYRVATTSSYGPRFLHSTGQLHKGDAGNGLFIQFTSTPPQDAPIPDEAGQDGSAMNFGVLILSQALGDRQALLDNGRRVIRFHLHSDVAGDIAALADEVGG